jgi:DNA-binding transcriptional regulator YhcF (GntR family)
MAPHTPPPFARGVITGPTRLPERSQPARRRVKMVLHRGIVTGIIPGGTRLVQSSIAAELAVSTWPVREALRELAAEGFVRFDGRGGAVVRELCRTELEDIYEIRMMLEPVATAPAAMSATGPACGPRSSCWRPWRPRPAARAGPNTTPASTTSSPWLATAHGWSRC